MRAHLSLAAGAALVGCTLVTSFEGLSGGADPTTPDAAPVTDASTAVPEAAATDAGVDAGNLFAAGDFESTTICSGQGFNSTLDLTDSNPHGGKEACRVCARETPDPIFTLDRMAADAKPVVGAVYRATAWVRTPQNEDPPPNGIFLNIRNFGTPFSDLETASAQRILTTDWASVTVDLKVTKPGDGIDVYIGADKGSNICFVVDDFSLVRIQ